MHATETRILILLDEPFRRIRWLDRPNLKRNVNFEFQELLRSLYWKFQCSANGIMNVAVTLCFATPRSLRALYCVVLCGTLSYGVVEGSLNSKLRTIWRVEKQIDEVKSEDEVESEEKRCNSAKVRRKKIHPRQMLEKSRNAVFFQ